MVRRLKSKRHTTLRSILFVAVTLSVSACFGNHAYQLEDWQKNPKACAEFWDNYFPKALNGDDAAARDLYYAILHRHLVPPGRQTNAYRQEQKDFDLLALKRLSVHEHREITGDSPGTSPWSETIWMGGRYMKHADPANVQGSADNRILREYMISSTAGRPRICGGDSSTKEWAAACRKILADDGVLPSSEQFLATIPKNANACGLMMR